MLLQQSTDDLIFLTWEWQSAWWASYSPGELWVLAVYTDENVLVGIAPWFIETQASGERVVRSVGCVEVTDYLSVIVHVDHTVEVYTAIADYLQSHTDQFDVLSLCNIPSTSELLKGFREILEARDVSVEVVLQEVCPVITLPDTFPEYVQNLDKKQRHELRRKMRKIDGLGADVSWYIVGKDDDLEAEMRNFLALMRSASEEKGVFLDDPQNVVFFERVVPLMQQNGWLQLSFIKLQDEYAAAYLSFSYNNRLLVYNSGLDATVGGTLSPGIVLLGYLIRDAIAARYTHFDFLRGDEEYKYQMGAENTEIMNLTARFLTAI